MQNAVFVVLKIMKRKMRRRKLKIRSFFATWLAAERFI
jgi:hypothetical protein